MASLHVKDKERLMGSVLLAILFHVGVFFLLQYLDRFNIPDPEYTGPVFVELESEEVETAREQISPPENPEEPPPGEDVPEIPPPEKEDPEELPDEEAIGLYTPKPSGTPRPTEPEKTPGPIVTAAPSKTREPQNTPAPAEESGLSGFDWEKLNQSLNAPETEVKATPAPGSSEVGDRGSGQQNTGQGTSEIQWEKHNTRSMRSKKIQPVIPEGVYDSHDVKVTFELTPQGFLRDIKADSPFPEINTAIEDALKQWRFNAVDSTENLKGELTYKIKSTQ